MEELVYTMEEVEFDCCGRHFRIKFCELAGEWDCTAIY